MFVVVMFVFLIFFCFKQKTAYEMRISDCSSDVCSSDLGGIETADAAKGYEMALQIRAGSVALNGGTGRMTYAPIGGYKRSGIGREYGPDWLREYQQEKSIFYPVGR